MRRFFRTAAWDGGLPILAIVAPLIVRVVFPEAKLLPPLMVLFLPPCVAGARAKIGARQLIQEHGDSPPLLRQIALAAAIVLLLIFDVFVVFLAFNKGERPVAWLVPVGCYVAYLMLVLWALRPVHNETSQMRAPVGRG